MKDYRVIQIERLIVEGDVKTALMQLSQFFEQFESDLANDTLLYLGQLNSYERDVQQGIAQKGGGESIRIQRATLTLKDEVQSILQSKGQVQEQAPTNQPVKAAVDRFTYIYEDTFIDNRNEWYEDPPTAKDSELTTKYHFENNQYVIDNRVEDNSLNYVGTLCVLDPDQDFKIEATIETHNIGETAFFGLVWGGHPEMSGFHGFSLNSSGNVCVDTSDNSKEGFDTHLGWTYFAPVQEGKGINILTIEKDKQKLKFFVNGKLAHINPFLPFYGNVIGIAFANILTIGIKQLRVGIA